jgi:predicted DCC family thiol-disulfide oxidoreductase YuxK
MLIFDGDCGFCSTCVRFVQRRIPADADIAPYQRVDLARFGVSTERAAHEVLWVDAAGQVSGGADAVGELLTQSGGWRRPVGRLVSTPPVSFAARGVYRLVSRYRYRLPGGTPACRTR